MKNLFLYFFIASSFITFAQKDNSFFELNLFINYENGIQDNQLNQAHNYGKGLGIECSYIIKKNLKFGVGFQYNRFGVIDESFIGNYSSTRFKDFYLMVSYQYTIYKKFSIEPNVQLGISYLKQLADDSTYDTNSMASNLNFNYGMALNYRLSNKTILFLRSEFVTRNFEMNTVDQYKDFFNNNKTFSMNLGIKLQFK
jgi:hypothetical protein